MGTMNYLKDYKQFESFKFKKNFLLKYSIMGLILTSSLTLSDIKDKYPDNKKIKNAVEELKNEIDSKWDKGYNFELSDTGLEMIKSEEKLRLTAYSIGDKKITIGWGHAEPEEKSKYKVGDKITKKVADELLKSDLEFFENGVKRIFKQWEKENINRKITQEMYDTLVSLAYNMGVSGLRQTQLIQDIKKGNYRAAGEKIKKTAISDDFPGLEVRRSRESDYFLTNT